MISPRPDRGPDASQRTSLAIFISAAASVRSAPWASTRASCAARAANLFGAETNGSPVSSAIFAGHPLAELGWALSPVPTAVPPMRQLVQAAAASASMPREAVVELGDVARELLAERERHGVLEVRAADLDDRRRTPAPWLAACRAARVTAGSRRSRTCSTGGDVHGRREGVVGGLDRLTSSFGWIGFFEPSSPPASSMARLAMTSLAFMLVWVPLPGLPDAPAGSGRRACRR